MTKVLFNMSMSIDGFIAGPNDGPGNGLGDNGGRLFAWYNNGDIPYKMPKGSLEFKFSKNSEKHFKDYTHSIGAIITGKRTFEITNGWNGEHPIDAPVFVLTHHKPTEWIKTHSDAPFIFITDGIEHAVAEAKKIAGKKDVAISTASTFQQSLKAGLLNEIIIDIAPIILGDGIHLFEELNKNSVKLEQISSIEGIQVTHLSYKVLK